MGGARTYDLPPAESITIEFGARAPAAIRVIVFDRISGAFATRTIRRSP
jgi:hypothetical protein